MGRRFSCKAAKLAAICLVVLFAHLASTSPATTGEYATIHVDNLAGDDILVNYHNNPGPVPINNPQPGPLGRNTTLVVPIHWGGMISIGKSIHPNVPNSLIEASYLRTPGVPGIGLSAKGVPSMDVSYANGFSVPIVCTCKDFGTPVFSGCSLDLFELGICPASDLQESACHNPKESELDGNARATDFFLPCDSKAFAFGGDTDANMMCHGSSDIYCCVGSDCVANPKQGSPAAAGTPPVTGPPGAAPPVAGPSVSEIPVAESPVTATTMVTSSIVPSTVATPFSAVPAINELDYAAAAVTQAVGKSPSSANSTRPSVPSDKAVPLKTSPCDVIGQVLCSPDGMFYAQCDAAYTLIWGPVAPGTKCKNGYLHWP